MKNGFKKISVVIAIIILIMGFIGCDSNDSIIEEATYSIVFENIDGTELLKLEVKEGEYPKYDLESPSYEDEEYTYSFIGWDKEISEASANQTYTAVFEKVEKEKPKKVTPIYTVSFVNKDGSLIKKIECKEGQMPTYDGEEPTYDDSDNEYTFKGWNKKFKKVYSNQTYTAEYDVVSFTGSATFYTCSHTDPKSHTEACETVTLTWDELMEDNKTREETLGYRHDAITYTEVGYTAFCVYDMAIGTSRLKEITVKKGVTVLSKGAFDSAYHLESVKLPPTVKTIELFGFYECVSLKSINLENVTSYGDEAFELCTKLTSITLSDELEVIPYMCFAKSGLVSFSMPESVNEIDECAFEDCEALSSINIVTLNPNVKYVWKGYEYIFEICSASNAASFFTKHCDQTWYKVAICTKMTYDHIYVKINNNKAYVYFYDGDPDGIFLEGATSSITISDYSMLGITESGWYHLGTDSKYHLCELQTSQSHPQSFC